MSGSSEPGARTNRRVKTPPIQSPALGRAQPSRRAPNSSGRRGSISTKSREGREEAQGDNRPRRSVQFRTRTTNPTHSTNDRGDLSSELARIIRRAKRSFMSQRKKKEIAMQTTPGEPQGATWPSPALTLSSRVTCMDSQVGTNFSPDRDPNVCPNNKPINQASDSRRQDRAAELPTTSPLYSTRKLSFTSREATTMAPADRRSLELAAGAGAGPEPDDDGRGPRTGNIWTCVAHVITGVIGVGVLALSWSVAQLGWVAGPIAMLCFAAVTYVSALLLSHCYRSPGSGDDDEEDRKEAAQRNYTYMDAVGAHLGKKQYTWVCGFLQYLNLYGTAVAYTITTATCLSAIKKANCYHGRGRGAPCGSDGGELHLFMLLFGAAQVVLSFIPNFHSMAWLSFVAAAMSFTYASIGIGLGLSKTIGNGTIKGGIAGIPMATPTQKVWRIAQAIGDIAFSYPYTIVLLEIQDTLRRTPPEGETMRKGNAIAVGIVTFFYLSVGCFGYAAFGDAVPGNLLTGFGFYEPFWLVDFANACIIIHLLGGYQMFSQQIFTFADRRFAARFPDNAFVNKVYYVRIVPGLPAYGLNLQRLCFRTAYVASTTGLAVVFPYFNEVLGLLGALIFWPLVIYLPVKMYCVQKGVRAWTPLWVVLQAFSGVCFAVGTFAFVGSCSYSSVLAC